MRFGVRQAGNATTIWLLEVMNLQGLTCGLFYRRIDDVKENTMKRTLLIVASLLSCLNLYAFGAEESTEAETTSPNETATETAEDESEYDPLDFVELGDYLGIEIEVPAKKEVSEADVDEQIEFEIRLYEIYEPTDKKTVEEGDLVNVDFSGTMDGEPFEGGEAMGRRLTVGARTIAEGFDESLLGRRVGETFEVSLTLPDDYSEDLAGKEATFSITVNSIDEPAPYSDEVAGVLSDGECPDAEEYRERERKTLEKYRLAEWESEASGRAMEELTKISKVIGFPDGLVERRVEESLSNYKAEAEQLGTPFETYLNENFGLTEKELFAGLRSEVEEELSGEMIVDAIAEKEEIVLSDKEFADGCERYAEQFWCDSLKRFVDEYGEENVRKALTREKTLGFVVDNAIIAEEEQAD